MVKLKSVFIILLSYYMCKITRLFHPKASSGFRQTGSEQRPTFPPLLFLSRSTSFWPMKLKFLPTKLELGPINQYSAHKIGVQFVFC